MKNKLIVKGKQEFLGKEIPIIEGGFGENKKVILENTIILLINKTSIFGSL